MTIPICIIILTILIYMIISTTLICMIILTILIKILHKTMKIAFWISFQNAFFYVSQNVLTPVIHSSLTSRADRPSKV